MIQNLHIENIAIMDNVELSFQSGLCILTGETGAGKSIIIDSVNLLTGERSSKEIVRHGAEKAVVEGVLYTEDPEVFDILKENGIEAFDGDPIILRREISTDSRSLVRINGRVTTTSLLREICSKIINIHGQNDNQAILNVSYHAKLLDSFAETEKELSDYKNVYNSYKDVCARLGSLSEAEKNFFERRDMLTFKVQEIEKANLKKGEYDSLKEMRTRFLNTEKITSGINDCFISLDGGESGLGINGLIDKCISGLDLVASFEPSLSEDLEKLNDIKYSVLDITENIIRFKNSFDENEIDINTIESRIDIISSLKKKYGDTEEEILENLDAMKKELLEMENADFTKAQLEKEKSELLTELKEKALILSEKRKKKALILEKAVNKELSELEMQNAVFKVDFKDTEFSENGIDKMEFMISTNKGEPLKPMCKIASGGELSRIILALKVILSESDSISTMVFDEVDTGVSGSAAEKIARKIKTVSKNKQVFVITHLPQVAAFADYHYKVKKVSENDKTTSEVVLLDYDMRIEELARLMSGSVITDSAKKTAGEMLKNSNG